jgi:hypothetical protein
MAILSNSIAYSWWSDYLKLGYIFDGKHGITFSGKSAYGHLTGISLLSLILNYFFIRSAINAFKKR